MFQGLTAGMPVYILYKNDPKVVEARVVTANTHPQMPNPSNPMAILNGPVTDLTVSVDGKNLPPFQGLSPQAMMATFSNDGMVISEDMGIIKNEMKSEREKHQRIVDCYKPSKDMVSKYDALLLSYDPDRQRELEKDKEIAELKAQLQSNNAKLDDMMNLMSAVLGKKKKEE
jgi:hypothetical protein